MTLAIVPNTIIKSDFEESGFGSYTAIQSMSSAYDIMRVVKI
jgi:hypothetical protein